MSIARPRLVTVSKTELLTPELLRLVLTGDLDDYPTPQPAAHFKLFLPKEGQTTPSLPDLSSGRPVWDMTQPKPWVRTYTVREFIQEQQALVVDVVLHESGPATDWARQAEVGSQVGISVSGGPNPMLPEADRYWLAGDLCSVPAIASLLENMPEDAQGDAWFLTEQDVRDLVRHKPQNMQVHWVPLQASRESQLLQVLRDTGWPSDVRMTVWVAGEHHDVVAMRDWLRGECGLPRTHLYAVPYWKRDATEEIYHEQRHEVMDEFN